MPRTLLLCLIVWACGLPGEVSADDFRLQTKVYKEDETEPSSENLTLFRAGQVYDFLADPLEVTIFDRPRGERPGRFVLLDPARQVQTEVSLAEVQQFMQKISGWAAGKDDSLLHFLARPQFSEQAGENGVWTYTSQWMTYEVKSDPAPSPHAFQQFDEFSDWFVRLNTMLTIRVRPPYGLARLAVNASLRQRQEIPREVLLTVTSGRLIRKQATYRSEHQLTTFFSLSDLARIEDAKRDLVRFTNIPLEQYLHTAADTSEK